MTRKPSWEQFAPVFRRRRMPRRPALRELDDDQQQLTHGPPTPAVAQASRSSAAATANRARCSHAMRCNAMRWHITWALEPARSTKVTRPPHHQCPSRRPVCRALFCSRPRSLLLPLRTLPSSTCLPLAASLRHRHSGASSQWIAIRLARAGNQRYTRALFPALGAGFGFLCCCFTAHRTSHSSRGACLPCSRNEDSILPITPAVHRLRTKSYRHSCALLLILRLTPAARRNQGMAAAATVLVGFFQPSPREG